MSQVFMSQSGGMRVGMIGLGTVGGGVVELLRRQPVELVKVAVRDAARHRLSGLVAPDRITDRAEDLLDDPTIGLIVEVAGGLGVRPLIERAIDAGKHVVTANKSLLAAHGPELFERALRRGVAIAFEASCGGGVPMIDVMTLSLTANRFSAMVGILNGTCNDILTKMSRHGAAYADALAQAQRAGFAEADPTLDVSGADAAQKLAILAALAFGCRVVVERDIYTEGIDRLDPADIARGDAMGYTMKLLAIAERHGEELSLAVEPCFIPHDDALAKVDGPFNALTLVGDAAGPVTLVGRGAGRLPTASAVVGDILKFADGWYPRAFAAIVSRMGQSRARLTGRLESRFFLRINTVDEPGSLSKISGVLAEYGISIASVVQPESASGQVVPIYVTTHNSTLEAMDPAVERIESLSAVSRPVAYYRMLAE